MNAPKAVVLLSGGLDSATTLAIARSLGFEAYALSLEYGQRHEIELAAARRVAIALGAQRHLVLPLDLRAFGGSALTDDIEVPKSTFAVSLIPKSTGLEIPGSTEVRECRPMPPTEGIPVTYVPARNTIFLSLALGWAEVLGAQDIFIGVNAVDYSGYPDCRPEFIQSFEKTANLATKAGVEGRPFRIHAPLVELTKPEIIRKGLDLGVNYGITHSCYDPDPEGKACGLCDSCRIRRSAFAELGMDDSAP
ncbi:MAG: 7-cyano-7-deazaguanine synthase QueC [Fimbriimonadaceae bacterium]|nr:7-cyano-7-deazaguanine synthase QueC [Fimbriimonadaceae bacterium]